MLRRLSLTLLVALAMLTPSLAEAQISRAGSFTVISARDLPGSREVPLEDLIGRS